MKTKRSYLRSTTSAVSALGAMVAAGRRERGWTAADFAGRLGVSAGTLRRIESGDPGVAVGIVFEAATLCGVELFSTAPRDLAGVEREARLRLAVLPERVRSTPVSADDDF